MKKFGEKWLRLCNAMFRWLGVGACVCCIKWILSDHYYDEEDIWPF